MAFELPPDFIDQVRQIRGTSIISEDYDCLLKDKHKVQSTIMNAFGAQLQNTAYKEGFKNFVIFSSWLGPLQSGKVPPGPMAAYGSIEGHVHAAVRVLQVTHAFLSSFNLKVQHKCTSGSLNIRQVDHSTLWRPALTLGLDMD